MLCVRLTPMFYFMVGIRLMCCFLSATLRWLMLMRIRANTKYVSGKAGRCMIFYFEPYTKAWQKSLAVTQVHMNCITSQNPLLPNKQAAQQAHCLVFNRDSHHSSQRSSHHSHQCPLRWPNNDGPMLSLRRQRLHLI